MSGTFLDYTLQVAPFNEEALHVRINVEAIGSNYPILPIGTYLEGFWYIPSSLYKYCLSTVYILNLSF